jgi:hydrogenase maturation protease
MNIQKTIVLGLGNEYISDDGVGIHVVRELRRRLQTSGFGDLITLKELAVGGLPLLDHLVGYERCIIVDAVVTGNRPPGTVYRFQATADQSPRRAMTSHQTDLSQILRLMKILRKQSPKFVTVYGVEASDVTTFNDRCTELVEKAIPKLSNLVYHDLFDASFTATDGCVEWETITAIPTEQLL